MFQQNERIVDSAPFVLRIVVGLWLLSGPIWLGTCYYENNAFSDFSMLNLLAAVFTLNFALGRWRSWVAIIKKWNSVSMMKHVLFGQLCTFACQWILCSILFAIGRGIRTIFRFESKSDHDRVQQMLFVWSTVSVFLGAALIAVEKHTGAVHGLRADFRDTIMMTNEATKESSLPLV